MKLADLLKNLFLKAGVEAADVNLVALLASPELSTLEVNDDLSTTIDKGLLNIEAAKNNHPDIKKKYKADFMDGIDAHIFRVLGTDTFEKSDIDEIKAEVDTNKKFELIISKLKAAKSQAKGADKEEINRQLAAAHEEARLAKLETTSIKADYEGRMKDKDKKAALSVAFANYKTIYDELPADIRTATMEAIINKSLQDKNAVLSTDENGNFILTSKDGTSNVFGSNHVQLTPTSFLDQSFAPILSVAKKPVQPQRQTPPTTPAGSEDANAGLLKSYNDRVLADMAEPKSSMI